FGRTVHSLLNALSRYEDLTFVLIAPEELQLPSYVTDMLTARGARYRKVGTMEEVMPELDILYMTRVQKERFFNEADYIRLKDSFILTPDKLENAKKSLKILHPLPRVNEIARTVDDDPRAVYFKQVYYGKIMRMALILKMMAWRDEQ
ncbi:MAG: aspartate carbamoyltransferase, partial [Clostridia bacterium]